jgi:hypothetical protein
MAAKKIKLGVEARDVATGFTGIVTQRIDQLNGNVQYALQPKSEDPSVMKDPIAVDHHMLEYVSEGVVDRVTEVTHKTDIKVGEELEDILTGARGIATDLMTYMNGCQSFTMVTKISKTDEDKGGLISYVQTVRAKRVGPGIKNEVAVAPKAANGKTPGGPARRLSVNTVRR